MLRGTIRALIVSAALLVSAGTASVSQAEIMYAVTDGCPGTCVPDSNGVGRLLTIDTVTGVQTVINNDLGAGPLQSLAAMPSGLLYSISTTGLLIAIDPLTGTATNTGTQIVTPAPISALAANANGDLYGITRSLTPQLYKINPATGATLVGNTGGIDAEGLDFSPSGILYGSAGHILTTFNTTTGLAGPFIGQPQATQVWNSIAFDSTGTLWAVSDGGGFSGILYTIDPATSTATKIFENGLNGTITGIEFLPAPVPVPAAFWLFGSGIAAMAGLARRNMREQC